MGLLESIKEDEEQLKKLQEGTAKEEVDPEPTIEEHEEESKEDEKTPDPDKEEEIEDKPSDAAYARIRREKKAAEVREQELQRQLDELRIARNPEKKEESNPDPQPNRQDNYEAWLEWNIRQTQSKVDDLTDWKKDQTQTTEKQQTIQGAIREFQVIETEFKKGAKDYDQAADYLHGQIKRSISLLNPSMKGTALDQATDMAILTHASGFAQQKLNPAEELYHMAQEHGYKLDATQKQEKPTPNLKKIEDNKRRSATPLKAGGQNGSLALSKEAAIDMSMAEFAKLTPIERAELGL